MLNNDMMKLLFIVFGACALMYLLNKRDSENFYNSDIQEGLEDENTEVEGLEEGNDGAIFEEEVKELPASNNKKDQLNAQDLLPKDKSSKWAKSNPEGKGSVSYKNFLNAGHHVGINTQGQSLRNASYDLRSEPANPRKIVSPWLNSTIDADTNKRPFEIGGCAGEEL
jgi:hypothetical protein